MIANNSGILTGSTSIPLLPNEKERIAALNSYHILDTVEEKDFDDLAALASVICQTPVALISFVDQNRQWFKSHKGIISTETPREHSFCAHAIASSDPIMIINDANADQRFANNPLVTQDPHIAFYAGVPLINKEGFALGTLCVIDQQVRTLSDEQRNALIVLAQQVTDKLELRRKISELQALNLKLGESENRFRNLVNQAPVAIAIYSGAEMIIEQANEQILKLWGRTAEVIGLPLLKARPEMIGHPYLDILTNIFSSGKEHYGYEIEGPTLFEGKIKQGYFDAIYKPIKNDKGLVIGVAVVATDITEKVLSRKREIEMNAELLTINKELTSSNQALIISKANLQKALDDLALSESRLRYLLEDAPVAIAVMTGRGLIVESANKKVLEIWGKSADIIGLPLQEALPELEGQVFLQLLDEVFTKGEPFEGHEVMALLEQNGKMEEVYSNFVYHPLKNAEGEINSIMLVATIVTKQVKARQQTLIAQEQYTQAIETADMGTWSVDPQRTKLTLSDRSKHLFGLSLNEYISFEDAMAAVEPEYHELIAQAVNNGLELYQSCNIEYPIINQLSRQRSWVRVTGKMFFDKEGKPDHYSGIIMDITDRKLREQRKDDFINVASHELKTPITTLKASLQLLNAIKNKPFSPKHIQLIEQANRSVEKMTALVDDLLNVQRIAGEQLHLRKSTFNFTEIINNCYSHLNLSGTHKLIIKGNPLLHVKADEARIEQVVVNFVNNAVKYAPDSNEIILNIEQLDQHVKIVVQDNGPGISKEKLPHLFTRYYKANHSDKAYTGLGLGLYISAEIIERHAGEIGVESELGKGSTFWFTLPA